MAFRPTAVVLTLAGLAACAGEAPERTGLRTIPVPPPMPATPIPPEGRPADLQTAQAGACVPAVFLEVAERIAGVQQVQVDGASYVEYPPEGDVSRITGVGRYYTDGDEWQPFRFRCVYDRRLASITAFDIVPL
ncbi:MAG: hypothetical protein ACOC3D_10750 [Pseudomonadota bacterium]